MKMINGMISVVVIRVSKICSTRTSSSISAASNGRYRL